MNKNHVDISDESSMYRLEGRLKSFSETVLVEGKRCRWPYKVIPSQGMSDLGYFYYPIKDNTEPVSYTHLDVYKRQQQDTWTKEK